jgi:AcrR family transcriptional regulator
MVNSNHQSTEQNILEVAEKLFLQKGFAMTSTTEIARVVGCNQALVHYYYRSKEKLFAAIFEKKINLFFAELIKMSDENISFEEKLIQKIEAHFDMLKENPQLPFLIFNELISNTKRLSMLKGMLKDIPYIAIKTIQNELNIEIEKGNIRKMTVADLAITVVSMNVMLFIGKPIFENLFTYSEKEFEQFVEHRKQENIRIIMSSLKP